MQLYTALKGVLPLLHIPRAEPDKIAIYMCEPWLVYEQTTKTTLNVHDMGRTTCFLRVSRQ